MRTVNADSSDIDNSAKLKELDLVVRREGRCHHSFFHSATTVVGMSCSASVAYGPHRLKSCRNALSPASHLITP